VICAFAVALVAGGVAIGVIGVISLAIHREERAWSLTSDITDRLARGARRVNGACTRGDGFVSSDYHRPAS